MFVLALLLTAILVLLLYGAFTEDARGTAWLTGLASLAAAWLLASHPVTGGAFAGPSGALLLLTPASNLVWMVLLLAMPLALALAGPHFRQAGEGPFRPEFPILMLLSLTGMLVLVAANDFLALYVGLELMSFPLYILAAFKRNSALSAEAGLKYFVLGALASGLFLYGVGLLYAATGSTGFLGVLGTVTLAGVQPLTAVGLALVLAAMLFKLSAVPFHVWTPDVYEGAPTPATAFLGTLPKLAAIAILLRVLNLPLAPLHGLWQPAVMTAAMLSMFLGSAVAIVQSDLKRLLAYSTIGNVGFMLVGVGAATTAAQAGVLFYAVTYLLGTLGMFAALIALGHPQPATAHLRGLVKTRPWLAAVLVLNLFSLAGIPPLAGFMAKLNVFLPAVAAGHAPVVVGAVVASIIALVYCLLLIKTMVFDTPSPQTAKPVPLPAGLVATLAVTTAAAVVLGVFPQPLLELCRQAVSAGLF